MPVRQRTSSYYVREQVLVHVRGAQRLLVHIEERLQEHAPGCGPLESALEEPSTVCRGRGGVVQRERERARVIMCSCMFPSLSIYQGYFPV